MFNEELNISRAQYPEYTSYAVGFTFNGKSYVSLALGGDAAGGNMYFPHSSATNSVVYSHGNWFVDGRIIRFTGGTDATNADLIAFMQENAERIKSIADTIAEKLVIIAENEQKVYDKGYQKGHNEGKQAEHDAFWDAFQTSKRRNYTSMFQDASWSDKTFYPKYDITPVGSAPSLFRYCAITNLEERLNECGVVLDTSNATSLNAAFGECYSLTTIPTIDLTKCTASGAANGVFSGCSVLKTIRKIIISETVPTNTGTFQNCLQLQNLEFEGVIGNELDFRWSTKLTRASIESIVNHLSDTTTGKTLTLSKTAVDEAFKFVTEIDGEVIIVNGSEMDSWKDLVASKPNWTITLV